MTVPSPDVDRNVRPVEASQVRTWPTTAGEGPNRPWTSAGVRNCRKPALPGVAVDVAYACRPTGSDGVRVTDTSIWEGSGGALGTTPSGTVGVAPMAAARAEGVAWAAVTPVPSISADAAQMLRAPIDLVKVRFTTG